jgi:hypothetical protein
MLISISAGSFGSNLYTESRLQKANIVTTVYKNDREAHCDRDSNKANIKKAVKTTAEALRNKKSSSGGKMLLGFISSDSSICLRNRNPRLAKEIYRQEEL